MYVTRYDIFGPNAALRNQRNNITNAAHYKYNISPAVLVCFTIKPLLFVENLFTVNGTCIYILLLNSSIFTESIYI
jgi:hypothetical protein